MCLKVQNDKKTNQSQACPIFISNNRSEGASNRDII